MLKPNQVSLLFVGLFTLATIAAHAGPVLDFEGVTPPGTRTGSNVTPYTEDGFTLTSSGAPGVFHNDIFNNVAGDNGNGNTTSIFGWSGDAPYVFTLSGPGPFSLFSIDFGGLGTGQNPGLIDITGFFSGGGSISQTIDPAAVFATSLFPGFVNLSSLQFGLRFEGSSVSAALDNIVLNAPAAIPEPTSLLLLGTGAAGLLAKAQRRRRQRIQ